ncbi:MAG: hypothetical protein QXX95_05475 [Nitrososphaerales archaeon]
MQGIRRESRKVDIEVKVRLEEVFGKEATKIILKAYEEDRLKEAFGESVAELIRLIMGGKFNPLRVVRNEL